MILDKNYLWKISTEDDTEKTKEVSTGTGPYH